jgi:hypothetical protein
LYNPVDLKGRARAKPQSAPGKNETRIMGFVKGLKKFYAQKNLCVLSDFARGIAHAKAQRAPREKEMRNFEYVKSR